MTQVPRIVGSVCLYRLECSDCSLNNGMAFETSQRDMESDHCNHAETEYGNESK